MKTILIFFATVITAAFQPGDPEAIRSAARSRRMSATHHYLTMGILLATLAVISLYFALVYPLRDPLSLTAMGLMFGGLGIRIIVEVISLFRLGRIRLTDTAADNTRAAVKFHRFRKRIQGPVSLGTVLAYVAGFFLLTPAWIGHLSTGLLVYIYASFLVLAVVLFLVARKGIRREMESLENLRKIMDSMQGDNP